MMFVRFMAIFSGVLIASVNTVSFAAENCEDTLFPMYAQRYRELVARFPEAFSVYQQEKYLIPTFKARWLRNVFEISARLTTEGRSKSDPIKIHGEYHYDKSGHTLHIQRFVASPDFTPAYAWKIFFAESLIEFPRVEKIELFAYWGDDDIRALREELAKGATTDMAVRSVPFVSSGGAFGFSPEHHQLFLEQQGLNNPRPHYPGELQAQFVLSRPPPPEPVASENSTAAVTEVGTEPQTTTLPPSVPYPSPPDESGNN